MEPAVIIPWYVVAIEAGKALYMNYAEILAHISAICSILIGIFMIIPGEQPEKFLKKIVEVISKFSKK